MAAITAGVFCPLAYVVRRRPVLGPSSHPGPTVAGGPWAQWAGPDGEGRRSDGLHPTAAIPRQRTNAVAVRGAPWRIRQSPPEVLRTGCQRTQQRLVRAVLAEPAVAAAACQGREHSTDIGRRRDDD